jgi:hypothetical protein
MASFKRLETRLAHIQKKIDKVTGDELSGDNFLELAMGVPWPEGLTEEEAFRGYSREEIRLCSTIRPKDKLRMEAVSRTFAQRQAEHQRLNTIEPVEYIEEDD